jgi:hypothetical protein
MIHFVVASGKWRQRMIHFVFGSLGVWFRYLVPRGEGKSGRIRLTWAEDGGGP